uniref:Uncharacterized protein n=1 Tax=Arundo donax TaxID=35708 RepID=A0A0A9FA28_ARUDO
MFLQCTITRQGCRTVTISKYARHIHNLCANQIHPVAHPAIESTHLYKFCLRYQFLPCSTRALFLNRATLKLDTLTFCESLENRKKKDLNYMQSYNSPYH